MGIRSPIGAVVLGVAASGLLALLASGGGNGNLKHIAQGGMANRAHAGTENANVTQFIKGIGESFYDVMRGNTGQYNGPNLRSADTRPIRETPIGAQSNSKEAYAATSRVYDQVRDDWEDTKDNIQLIMP